jgi:Ca2+/H+ antiporter
MSRNTAVASIGLTVPVVVLAAHGFALPLVLGLEPKDLAMLAVTLLVTAVTLGTGSDTHDAGGGAPGDLRGVPVPRVRALTGPV